MRPVLAFATILITGLALSGNALAQQKTATQCREEWRANKEANQAAHITERAYIEKCRAGTPMAAPAPSPATTPAPAANRNTSTPSTSAAAGQFQTEAQAKASCGGDSVVWVNTKSRVYHFPGTHNYGHTKSGAYMCERSAMAAGDRAAKNEKHP